MATDKSRVEYGYDVLGRPSTVTEKTRDAAALGSNAMTTAYTYDKVGNIATVKVSEGSTVKRLTTNTYSNDRHWLNQVKNESAAAGTTFSLFDYTRRADGQITKAVDTVHPVGGTGTQVTTLYTYDDLDRLTAEDVAGVLTSYTLDAVGNRIAKTAGGTTTKFFYDVRDRLTEEKVDATTTVTYGYDDNGAQTTRTAGVVTETQAWDIRGRLTGFTKPGMAASYTYTPDGIRNSTTENGSKVLYTIDAQSPSGYSQVIEERTASGVLTVSFVYGAGLDPVSMNRDYNLEGWLDRHQSRLPRTRATPEGK